MRKQSHILYMVYSLNSDSCCALSSLDLFVHPLLHAYVKRYLLYNRLWEMEKRFGRAQSLLSWEDLWGFTHGLCFILSKFGRSFLQLILSFSSTLTHLECYNLNYRRSPITYTYTYIYDIVHRPCCKALHIIMTITIQKSKAIWVMLLQLPCTSSRSWSNSGCSLSSDYAYH